MKNFVLRINDEIDIKYLYEFKKYNIEDISRLMKVSKSKARRELINIGTNIRSKKEAIGLVKHKLGRPGKRGPFSDITKENMRASALKRSEDTARGYSLKPSGYFEITKGENKGRSVHNIVMENHIGRRMSPDEVVHHINHLKTDNRIENLRLMTRSEHCKLHSLDRIARGLPFYDISKETLRGEDNLSSKLTEKQALSILRDNKDTKYYCKKYNVTKSTVNKIKRRESWKHLKI